MKFWHWRSKNNNQEGQFEEESKMKNSTITVFVFAAVLGIGCLSLGVSAATAANIDPIEKYAWSETVGWYNFLPSGGGVKVYPDHLEGYAWGENIGWVLLGSYSGGGTHTYANTSASDWGVNNDGSGNLSGYGWSETIGWISFNASGSQVTIDENGSFDGYGWSENAGWIHFRNADPAYNVLVDLSLTRPCHICDNDQPGVIILPENCFIPIAQLDDTAEKVEALGVIVDVRPNGEPVTLTPPLVSPCEQFEWRVFNLKGEDITAQAGWLDGEDRCFHFALTQTQGYYHVEAACVDITNLFYVMGVLVR